MNIMDFQARYAEHMNRIERHRAEGRAEAAKDLERARRSIRVLRATLTAEREAFRQQLAAAEERKHFWAMACLRKNKSIARLWSLIEWAMTPAEAQAGWKSLDEKGG